MGQNLSKRERERERREERERENRKKTTTETNEPDNERESQSKRDKKTCIMTWVETQWLQFDHFSAQVNDSMQYFNSWNFSLYCFVTGFLSSWWPCLLFFFFMSVLLFWNLNFLPLDFKKSQQLSGLDISSDWIWSLLSYFTFSLSFVFL